MSFLNSKNQMKGEDHRLLKFFVLNKSDQTFLFSDNTETSLLSIKYSPKFDPWDNFAAARYFYELFHDITITHDDDYVKMIQDEEFRAILGKINDSKILQSNILQKVFLIEFQEIQKTNGTKTLAIDQIISQSDQFDQGTFKLVDSYLIKQIHLEIEPIYICQLNPSPYADVIMKNIEEALHRGFHQEQNEVWITYNVAFGEFPSNEELLKFSSVIVNGSCSSVNDTSQQWIEDLINTIQVCASMGKRLYGVCFGHQIIAVALGGRVSTIQNFKYNLRGRKQLLQTLLVEGESYDNLSVLFAHSDEVVEVPNDTEPLLSTDHCSIVGYQGDNILGIQFHPEYNVQILKFLAMKDSIDVDKVQMFKEIDYTFKHGNDDSYNVQRITRAFLKDGAKFNVMNKIASPSTSSESNDSFQY